MKGLKKILEILPYADPFLFVDEILKIDENGCEGTYKFKESLPFYRGHFKDNPVTPGVILTECCAQIGLVCLGIYLCLDGKAAIKDNFNVVLTSSEMEFMKPVYPGEKVRVHSEKQYFRFSKLKCKVVMYNDGGEIICRGQIAGIFKSENHG